MAAETHEHCWHRAGDAGTREECHCGEVRWPDFDEWWRALREIAAADPDGDSAGPDQESFRDWWEDGESPEDAYASVWEDIRR